MISVIGMGLYVVVCGISKMFHGAVVRLLISVLVKISSSLFNVLIELCVGVEEKQGWCV